MPRQYRNTNEIPLGPQWIFTWNFLKLHHFYTNDPQELELTKNRKSNRQWVNCGKVLLLP